MRHNLVLLLSLVLSPAAAADTLDVPDDFVTIQAAVDAAVDGDEIRVAKGTHAGFVLDGKTGITIKGKGKPVLDGGGALGAIVTVANASGIVLDGLVIRNSGERGVLITDSTDVTVMRCTIEQTAADGIRAWGSTGLLIEKNTIEDTGDGVDFSEELPSGPTSASIVSKNSFARNFNGVDVAGDGNLVEKNRIDDAEDSAVNFDDGTTNTIVAKNRIANPSTAVRLSGSGHVVEKNRVKGTRDEGITVEAQDCRVEKNRLDRVDDDAIDLEGDDNEILGNRITHTGDNGIEMAPADGDPFPVTGNQIEENRISSSDGDGVFIAATVAGNTLLQNRAAKSDGFDLRSDAAEAANTFDGNKFGTTQFP